MKGVNDDCFNCEFYSRCELLILSLNEWLLGVTAMQFGSHNTCHEHILDLNTSANKWKDKSFGFRPFLLLSSVIFLRAPNKDFRPKLSFTIQHKNEPLKEIFENC